MLKIALLAPMPIGERQDRGRRKRRRAAKLAHGVAHVAGEIVDRRATARRRGSPREPASRFRTRAVRRRPRPTRQALGHQLVDLLLEMQLDLVGERRASMRRRVKSLRIQRSGLMASPA